MIGFKQYLRESLLNEASTGAAKWEKYFSGGDTQTIVKADSALKDVKGNLTSLIVKKGDQITVLAGEYSTQPLIKFNGKKYTMPFANIDKPFKQERAVGVDLKPDKLGLAGKHTIVSYPSKLKAMLDAHHEIPPEQTEYLKALVDSASDSENDDKRDICRDLFAAHIRGDQSLINTINTDFMELLGPFFVVDENPGYREGGVKFPELGNEPLYDFTMKFQGHVDAFSSKKSGGNTNTLKVTEVLKAALTDSTLARKYMKEIELLRLIQDNAVKAAPDLINIWLAKRYKGYTPAAPTAGDATAIARLEAAVVKWINENSRLNFLPLVTMAVPDLYYVKSRLNSDGTIKVEPIKSGRDIDSVKLRSKSSPGHLSDKIGFQM